MQFAVALIEYLISGIIASIWVLAIITNYIKLPLDSIKDYKEIFVIVYFPVAYILGIYVDTTSSFLIRRIKELGCMLGSYKPCSRIIKFFLPAYVFLVGKAKPDSYERSAEVLAHSIPDAVRTMEAYVSRDRIARGAALNAFAGATTAFFYAPSEIMTPVLVGCLLMLAYSLLMYKRLRRLSSRFKKVVISKIKK
ncbi:hypothetical protein PS645_01825 [Pseudomonas fluorescens]|uniref:Uncharacterized protein n=1 Tax=Pseudomonas fluorescens TaxID=294 RepID=A0A5E6RU01_PSEFL|nr:hypothetical protein [Pseudomonas fluorescens]VVM72274.1 hypothetical protein PS645_01825 [Pseudomonas fluorescens]